MASAKLEATKVITAILRGDLDGDFGDLTKAMRERVNSGDVGMRWGLKVDDLDITAENQSIAEAMSVEKQTGKLWSEYAPANSAVEASAILVAALIERKGMESKAAFEYLKTKTADEIAKGVYEYTVGSPPKDGGEPPT